MYNLKEGFAIDRFHVADYRNTIFDTAKSLLAIDSPSGYYHAVMNWVENYAKALGFAFERNEKGCGTITVEGESDARTVLLAAHVDTLGLMVRSITDRGELKFTSVGGPLLPTLDGEYCVIHTRGGKTYTGTILSKSCAAHVYDDAKTLKRDEENMVIRIDEQVKNKEDVQKLGIQPGDYVCFDPKTTVTDSGFLKSRFIDDKGSVACLLSTLQILKDQGLKPQYRTKVFISVFEECGHGASNIPADASEMLAVDMGCIGLDLTCTEYDVSICAKDSGGPYDYEMTSRLIELAKENEIGYAVDIYPFYGSDVGAALRAGHNIKGALIGPGVHASHGMERTHLDGMVNTINLILLYLGCA